MHEIAFVTCGIFNDLTESDAIAASELKRHGINVTPLIWDDPQADTSRYDMLILRSCWDYHTKHEEFTRWLNTIEKQNTKIYNTARTVRKNMNKVYLEEFRGKGFAIPQTLFLHNPSRAEISDAVKKIRSSKTIIKPSVSAGAYKTHLIESEEQLARISDEELLSSDTVLVQEFMPEIITEGEYSLIFINKQYSHSVIKKPKTGDYRVQEEHGGTYNAAEPGKSVIEYAAHMLEQIKDDLLYARIDGVMRGEQFVIMEIELIEPELMFNIVPKGAALFANAVSDLLRSNND